MGTNKNATIRYHALDRCFSNHSRKFFMDDLIKACNEALCDYNGSVEGVRRRQVFEDIKFMESEAGWAVTLNKYKEGKRVYYRYSDKGFSIRNSGINQSEAEQIRETLSILSRFEGLPQLEWIEEIKVRLESTFHLRGKSLMAVSFQQNPFLKGLEHFSELFTAIQNQQVIEVDYQGYRESKVNQLTFHPWHLKQYNNRWFLFGFNDSAQLVSNLALDRIFKIKNCSVVFKNNDQIDFDEFFEDVVGVSVRVEEEPARVVIKILPELWPYIESKPIHGSQKIISKTETEVMIELCVQTNYELKSVLFSYMDGIEIIEPEEFREFFKAKATSILKQYKTYADTLHR